MIESSDDVILSKDLNGIITSWNAAATRVFGYAAEEMVGASILKLIQEPVPFRAKRRSLKAFAPESGSNTLKSRRLTKSGQLIDVSLTVSPLRDELGKVIGASKILRDISGRRPIEQSLLQAEKIAATGRMAATIAHEINNPLEAVMNLLYLLRPMITDPVGSTTSAPPKTNFAACPTSPSRRSATTVNTLRQARLRSQRSLYTRSRFTSQGVRLPA